MLVPQYKVRSNSLKNKKIIPIWKIFVKKFGGVPRNALICTKHRI